MESGVRVLVGVVFLAELAVRRLDLPLARLLIDAEDLMHHSVSCWSVDDQLPGKTHLVVVLRAQRNLRERQERQENRLEQPHDAAVGRMAKLSTCVCLGAYSVLRLVFFLRVYELAVTQRSSDGAIDLVRPIPEADIDGRSRG